MSINTQFVVNSCLYQNKLYIYTSNNNNNNNDMKLSNNIKISTGETNYWGNDINIVFGYEEHPHRGMEYYKYDNRYEMDHGKHFTIYEDEISFTRAVKRAQKQFAEFNK